MAFDLRECVIRVESLDGKYIAGTGFVVAEDLAVTCAHVVKALHVEPGECVRLTFHIGGTMEAKVLVDCWYPEQDVAFLRLSGSLPEEAVPAVLGPAEGCNGHAYIALGYPEDDEVQARWTQGNIGGLVQVERWPFDLLQLQGAEVDRGISGAPVLDLSADRVVGMMMGIKTLLNRQPHDPKIRYAYAIPSESISSFCPGTLKLHPAELSPLSVYPRTGRPHYDIPLIGRDEELTWLHNLDTDGLLVGQPGSGKTYLLQQLAHSGKGLFVVTKNLETITHYLSLHAPKVVMLDDAHHQRDLLLDLKRVRNELESSYVILATCWPTHKDSLMQALALSESMVCELPRLTRDSMVEIVRVAIPQATNALIRYILDQAEGRPGLAVTLADLCKKGDIQQVILGDALSRSFLTLFESSERTTIGQLLAAFAVGGEVGLSMETVAKVFALPVFQVREKIVNLATAGIVFESTRGQISVRPPILRFVLVREVFFGGATSLPISYLEDLIALAPDHVQATYTLVGAKAYNASIPPDWLEQQMENISMPDVWKVYASLGPQEASWALTKHPDLLGYISHPALTYVPELALPMLLTCAVGDERPLNSHPNHPLRIIEDWILGGLPDSGEALRRRQILLNVTKTWMAANRKAVNVDLKALQWVMSPKWGDTDQDPGSGRTISIRRGLLSLKEIHAVQALWPQTLSIIQTCQISDWSAIRALIETWVYPKVGIYTSSEELYKAIQAFAGTMIRDLLPVFAPHPGLCHWAKQISWNLEEEIEIPVDPEFEILYPQRDSATVENWEAQQNIQRQAVEKLACIWATHAPNQVVQRLAWFQTEVGLVGNIWPNWTFWLCKQLADITTEPTVWLEMFLDTMLPSEYVGPFLEKAIECNKSKWLSLAVDCLNHETLRSAALSLSLTRPSLPGVFLEAVLDKLEGYEELVKILCVRNQISEPVLQLLLRHDNRAIVEATVVGMWIANREQGILLAFRVDWEHAIVAGIEDDYWLSQILSSDAELATRWLEAQLREDTGMLLLYQYEKSSQAALSSLNTPARQQFLNLLSDSWLAPEIITGLIGDSPELYEAFLANSQYNSDHLLPLSRNPEGMWFTFALMALQAGYRPEAIAEVTCSSSSHSVVWESESQHWQSWFERFEALLNHEAPGIREIGRAGCKYTQARLTHVLREEHDEAVYGRF